VDRRFVREHAERLSREAMLLYFFLAAVADRNGLSFYRDGTLAVLLGMTGQAVLQARDELLAHDLIAHEMCLTQVLSLPPPGQRRQSEPGQGLMQLGRDLAPSHRAAAFPRRKGSAMNVGLWAEIRRLAEIEKLSGWAISRRLHCSRHTVAAALKLDQPPAREVAHRASLLDPHKAKINALVAKCPELSAVRIQRGDWSWP